LAVREPEVKKKVGGQGIDQSGGLMSISFGRALGKSKSEGSCNRG